MFARVSARYDISIVPLSIGQLHIGNIKRQRERGGESEDLSSFAGRKE
jgi:hypothetical protein